eukprot:scaffold207893_cov24-Tisochrysis_lutea.AAC.5
MPSACGPVRWQHRLCQRLPRSSWPLQARQRQARPAQNRPLHGRPPRIHRPTCGASAPLAARQAAGVVACAAGTAAPVAGAAAYRAPPPGTGGASHALGAAQRPKRAQCPRQYGRQHRCPRSASSHSQAGAPGP